MNYELINDDGKIKFIKKEEINLDFKITNKVFDRSKFSISNNVIDSFNIIVDEYLEKIDNSKNIIELEKIVNSYLRTFPKQLIVGGFNVPVNWISQNNFFDKMGMKNHSKILSKAINKRNIFLKSLL